MTTDARTLMQYSHCCPIYLVLEGAGLLVCGLAHGPAARVRAIAEE
jgi:hypothetical protein